MTSKQQNIIKLQNLADELGLYYAGLNTYSDGVGGELVFTYNLAEYKQVPVNNRCSFVFKQWFFLCAYVNHYGEFVARTKTLYPGFSKKGHFNSIEEVRQYIIDYMKYAKEHLVDMKLEKMNWDFND